MANDVFLFVQDFVSKLPGINTKNIVSLLNKGQSLDHLLTLSQVRVSYYFLFV